MKQTTLTMKWCARILPAVVLLLGTSPLVRAASNTATPIEHLVVIFDENVSFDHYFGTYPYAANPAGEPAFTAKAGTPTVHGLYSGLDASGQPAGPLLTSNPNLSNPQRLGHSDPMTCDQDHGYTHEQSANDLGAMDKFVQDTGRGATVAQCLAGFTFNGSPEPVPAGTSPNYAVMDYYDGNTVTGLWNLAQQYAMSDNAYTTNYGPSTPGAFNVTSGQTYGAICGPTSATINDSLCAAPTGLNTTDPAATTSFMIPASQDAGTGTNYSDADPTYDICTYLPSGDGGDNRKAASTITMGGPNIGTELSTAGVTWGWFQGGFDNGYVPGQGTQPTTAQICNERHANVGGNSSVDYNPHHEPFQYYAATANPINLPQVSYLKAADYQDGHAGYSDPNDEQTFLVDTINHLESLPTWSSTAVVVTYDDSDGWYDHVFPTIRSASQTSLDTLTGPGTCGNAPVPVNNADQPEQGRCGLGLRIPFLVVSPWSQSNYIASNVIDQSSVVKFIEQNWNVPALGNGAADSRAGSIMPMFNFNSKTPPTGTVFLDPATGEPTSYSERASRS